MLLQVSKAEKSYGGETIFSGVNFEIKNTEKIAIVGRNGCGKTTFLKCLCGEESFDKGSIFKASSTTIGYLSQKVIESDEDSVLEELKKNYQNLFDMQSQMEALEEEMKEKADQTLLENYASLQESFEREGGYQWEAEMKTVFTKFGFTLDDLSKQIKEFSGGEKTRIAFVKLYLKYNN